MGIRNLMKKEGFCHPVEELYLLMNQCICVKGRLTAHFEALTPTGSRPVASFVHSLGALDLG